MRVTKRSNIAVRLLMYCAANPDRLVTKSEVARCCNTSENHLAQVVNRLAHLDFLRTQRGRNGGLSLSRPAAEISIGGVFRALEASVPISECFADTDNSCPFTNACRLRLALQDAAEAFFARLDTVTLDALVCENPVLLEMLQPVACSRGPAVAAAD